MLSQLVTAVHTLIYFFYQTGIALNKIFRSTNQWQLIMNRMLPNKIAQIIILSCVAVFFNVSKAGPAEESNQVLAPGYGALQFNAPEPGTYQLPPIGQAGDGNIIDSDGRKYRLFDLLGDKIVLLSFIYSTCSDVNGCPLATAVFRRIKSKLAKQPELAKQLRLLTLSFNPWDDTPERMKAYGQGLQSENIDWRFLTTASEQELQPILQHYRQNIQKIYDRQGKFTGTFSHILRVYLIDREKRIRNIYSVSFLHPETLLNDVKTLLATPSSATQHPQTPEATPTEQTDAALYSAGDNKSGYETDNYQTRSIALTQRAGRAADLIRFAEQPPMGLPAVPIPADNPITRAKINLGRKLFYDRRLSLNNTFSCAMCHIPEQGFTSNEVKTAVGIEGRTVRRNSPTLYNVAYASLLFHDARENTLEQQVWGPLLAKNEMGNPSIGYVLDKINNAPDYDQLFEQAFGQGADMETVGMALASYQRTLNSANTPFDRWYFGGEGHAISNIAQSGFELFTGQAGCSACHRIDADSALFTDNKLHNTGVGYAESMAKTPPKQRLQVAPGVFLDVDTEAIQAVAETKPNDLGRYEITQNPEHRWQYKTPTLRNINLTAPYMHNGAFATLKEVVEFYNRGGVANDSLDPLIKPLHLNEKQIEQLVTFLQTLTGDNVDVLVSDAYAAPVGEMQ